MPGSMTAEGFAFFDTAAGRCGIAWGTAGIAGIVLPERSEAAMRARLRQSFSPATEATPPPEVQRAIDAIVGSLSGKPADLTTIGLDLEGVSPFHRRVYEAARAIPPGATLSYGELAARLGMPGGARAVGQALGRNPFPIVVPCHRVLAAGGRIGGFTANGGIATKLRLLSIEHAHANGTPLFEGDGQLGFDADAALAHLCNGDSALAGLIDTVGPFRMRLKKTPSIFHALSEAIVYQQLTGAVAATIFARLCALYPRPHEGLDALQILRTPENRLRSAGLSRNKLLSLKDLARKTEDGAIPTLTEAHGMEDEAIVERLTEVRGIGRWTVQMLLMFRLGRPDILPVDDYGVRKGFAHAYRKRKLPTPRELEKRGVPWKPYRTVASWYFWRAAERASSR
jgi:methylated-DNA-[protein]-cysteine S-methyltransferase